MSSTDPEFVGRVVDDRYRVLRHLADGGMASVYVALDERLDREVALKVMRPDLARDEMFVERFRREARSAARLSHPNVVAVYDQGTDGDLVFLAMELVEGRTLRELLNAEGAMTPRVALRTMHAILGALAAAHRSGIIHRDMKPENVLVTPEHTVKVADFGLARAITAMTSSTLGATVLGTVSYLAPEQVERGIADARSDVYSAGLMLFELLTGRRAVTGTSPIQVAYQHVHGEIPVPSQVVPASPAALDRLVADATRRDPDERPADAGAFLALLTRLEKGLSAAELDATPVFADGTEAPAVEPQQTERYDNDNATRPVPVVATQTAAGTGQPAERSAGRPAHQVEQAAPPATPRAAKPGRTRRVVGIVAALLLVFGGGTGWYMFLGPGSARIVPTLASLPRADAESALASVDLRADIHEEFSETVPRDQVISSDPGQGAEVRRGASVALAVSKGLERYAVPTVAGKSEEEAKAAISAAHLTVAKVEKKYDDKIAAGIVLSTDPAAGGAYKPNTLVTVYVSQGRKPVPVADWTGKPLKDAIAALDPEGIKVIPLEEVFSDDIPKGSIVKQTPASGTLYRGDSITVTVSKGPDLVTVPSVTGMGANQAVATLKAAGFQVTTERILGGIIGVAHSTTPAGGSQAPRGSTITLRIV